MVTRKHKMPTHTNLVMGALIAADDILSFAQIQERCPGSNRNQIAAALFQLRRHKAVDVIVQDDASYWMATADTDTRSRVVLERSPEKAPRNRKRKPVGGYQPEGSDSRPDAPPRKP